MAIVDIERPENVNAIWEEEKARFNAKQPQKNLPPLPGVPTLRYTSEAFFDIETQHLWTKAWILVGTRDELPQPGCYKTLEINGKPVLMIADKAGTIRAFYNTCLHRGAQLLRQAEGKVSSISCPYHAWNYELDGMLKFVPDRHDFPEFTQGLCEKSLKAIHCEFLGQLMFISFAPSPVPFADFIGDIADLTADVNWSGVRLYKKFTFDADCNWKCVHDAFSETYHVQYVHRDSVNTVLNRQHTARFMMPHGHNLMVVKNRAEEGATGRLNVFDRVDSGGQSRQSALKEITQYAQRSYNVFPNITIPVAANLTAMLTITPLSVGRCRLVLYYLKMDPAAEMHTEEDQQTVAAFNDIIGEDLLALQGMQVSLASGVVAQLTLGGGEQFIYNFHRQLDRVIGKEHIPPAMRVEDIPLPMYYAQEDQ